MTSKARKIAKTSFDSILVILCLIFVQTKAREITLSDISDSVIKSLTNCDEKNDTLSVCLKQRSVLILDKFTRATDTISLFGNSLCLVKDGEESDQNSTESHRSMDSSGLTQEKLDEYLPAEEGSRRKMLDTLLVGSVSRFLQTRSLQIKLPRFIAQFVDFDLSEGRQRRRRYLGAFVLGAILVAGTLIPVKMGTLALLSGKALITSVLAIALAGVVALKKLGGDKSPTTTTYEVINVPAGHTPHGHHPRSLPLSTLPPEVVDPTLLSQIINHHGDGPYTVYKSNYNNYSDSSSNGESDYLV